LRSEEGQAATSWPARAAWLALALGIGGPLAAQELQLPSGQPATLFDVVLEEGGEALAPDAHSELEEVTEEDLGQDPLDQPPAEPAEAPSAEAAKLEAPPAGLARFRLVVPNLGAEGAAFEDVAGDFLWLCEAVALPALQANGWTATEVVVSLSDRETEFGAASPEAVQFFEGFRISDGTCVPQAF
jgi:hypothetical protein